MSRTARRLIFGAIVAMLALSTAVPAVAGQAVERPFKGSETGTVVIDPDCVDFFAGCALDTSSTGTAAHQGRTTSTSSGVIRLIPGESCLLLDGTPGALPFRSSGTYTSVAADGSTISGTYENQGCAEFGTNIGTAIVGTQTITSGTGRFSGAAGQTVTSGRGFGAVFELSWRGTLTY
jgi:hypothetical protein